MTRRKRRQPTPHYKLPPAFRPDAAGGDRAPLMIPGIFPYTAMFQIAEEDTHRDYVVCRGHDTRTNRFYNTVAVAKPYGSRIVGVYKVGQVYAAILPLQGIHPGRPGVEGGRHAPTPVDAPIRVGQNPGVATVTPGHPADLTEEVEELYDDDDKLINWMLLESPMAILVELCLKEDHPGQATAFDCYMGVWDPDTDDWDYDDCSIEVKAIDHRYDVPYPDAGATGLFTPRPSTTHGTIFECVSLDCSAEQPCCPSSSPSASPSSSPSSSPSPSSSTSSSPSSPSPSSSPSSSSSSSLSASGSGT